jgi:predicted transcriptional regulator
MKRLVLVQAGTTATLRPVAIKIGTDIKERVKRFADARQRSPHRLMHGAIRQYVEREEKREAFREGAIKAWDEYQTTGLHVTVEEVDAWLAKLEAGHDVEPLECHA